MEADIRDKEQELKDKGVIVKERSTLLAPLMRQLVELQEVENILLEARLAGPESLGAKVAAEVDDTTSEYLAGCLPPFDADMLMRGPETLAQCLAQHLEPGLPLLPQHFTEVVQHNINLQGPLVSTADVPRAYTMINTYSVVETTFKLCMRYWPELDIAIKRNSADQSGATGEYTSPCMLGYAAAEGLIQFFCIEQHSSGIAQLAPISPRLNFNSAIGRLKGMLIAFNIWRLLIGYTSTGPVVPLPVGYTLKESSNGMRTVTLLPGVIRKCIRHFSRTHAEQFASFELLQELYAKMSKSEHRRDIIQACSSDGGDEGAGPRLERDEYVVYLAPVGVPCTGPPETEAALASAVLGVLRGLVALHSKGFVHRDIRWPNVIFLPAEQRWLLIDLEHAGREGGACAWHGEGGAYTAASDLQLVADLMNDLPYPLSASALGLQQQLLGGGLSAADALKHPWLTEA
ncbi:hypothetical protein GPECTOR_5g90 [Gonium pectorale]|uniref:Fungal-type protein kinase domain-containing protein n=1 Tax=Gonium pectorale TaxID=33097 RepID=A0A150GXM9_GONPE|nr:hypothetical protein GPECTOR_5g90 [Gonium pectorale]|eukprot:KXZ54438.1 hypothetical protein GPECTOR_5g90 [Gonium pectorale]